MQAPLDAAPIPVLITSVTGAVRFGNSASALLLGADATELYGRPILGMVRPEDRGLLARRMSAVVSAAATSDLLMRLYGRDRTVPCLVGGALVMGADSDRSVLWVLVRAGLWRADPGPADVTDLALALSRLALSHTPTTGEPIARVAQAATWCREVTGRGSEVSLVVSGPAGRLMASTSAPAHAWSTAQVDAGQGPLVDAERGEVCRSADLGADTRFPELTARIPHGHTVISRPVLADEAVCGTVTVYDAAPDLLAADDLVLPSLAATVSRCAATPPRGRPSASSGRRESD